MVVCPSFPVLSIKVLVNYWSCASILRCSLPPSLACIHYQHNSKNNGQPGQLPSSIVHRQSVDQKCSGPRLTLGLVVLNTQTSPTPARWKEFSAGLFHTHIHTHTYTHTHTHTHTLLYWHLGLLPESWWINELNNQLTTLRWEKKLEKQTRCHPQFWMSETPIKQTTVQSQTNLTFPSGRLGESRESVILSIAMWNMQHNFSSYSNHRTCCEFETAHFRP